MAVLAGQDAAFAHHAVPRPAPRGLLAPAGTQPTLLLAAAPLPPPAEPAHAIIARTTRRNEHSPLARIKSLNYLDSILARQEAAAAGADDAILLNTVGQVAEATAANLFVLHGQAWTTPPVAAGALPGITRARLLESGFACEADLTPERLLMADAAFLSSSLGLRGLASLEGRVFRKHGLCRKTSPCEAKSDRCRSKEGLLFEKKKQKTSTPLSRAYPVSRRQRSQKFFASFFQKRRPSLLLATDQRQRRSVFRVC